MSAARSTAARDALLLAAIAVASHPVWHGGRLRDDAGHLTSAHLEAASGPGRIGSDRDATAQYSPIVHSAFWPLAGNATLAHHRPNIALHATSAMSLLVARQPDFTLAPEHLPRLAQSGVRPRP